MSKEYFNRELPSPDIIAQEIIEYCKEGNVSVRRDALYDQNELRAFTDLRETQVMIALEETDPVQKEFEFSELRVIETEDALLRRDIARKRKSSKEYAEAEGETYSLLMNLYMSSTREVRKMPNFTEEEQEERKEEIFIKALKAVYIALEEKSS